MAAEPEPETFEPEIVEAEIVEPSSSSLPDRRIAGPLVGTGEVRVAALAAAGGLVAGAATVAAVRVVRRAAAGRPSRRLGRRRRGHEIVASRSFLVDVHVLGR